MWPSTLLAFTSAPAAMSSEAQSTSPLMEAIMRGVIRRLATAADDWLGLRDLSTIRGNFAAAAQFAPALRSSLTTPALSAPFLSVSDD